MGEVVALEAFRRRERAAVAPEPAPLPTSTVSTEASPLFELDAYEDAVQLVLGECEVWATPQQARELAGELLALADVAEALNRRGRR
jgi:hypothetical protein